MASAPNSTTANISSGSSPSSWMHIGLHGHSVGTFSADSKGIFWQSANNSSGDDDVVLSRFVPAKALASPAQWTVYGRTAHVRIHNTVAVGADAAQRSFPRELRFDGFPSNAFDTLKSLLQTLFRVDLVRLPVSVCGASFGNVAIDTPVATDPGHQNLVFRRCVLEDVNEEGQEFEPRDGEELMSINLADVSQCVLPGNSRNELELQFLESDTAEAGTDQLVAIRFFIPPKKRKDEPDDSDDDDDQGETKEDAQLTPAQTLQQQILASARIKSTSGNVIAEFNEDMGTFLTPRGRYSIELYDSFLRMRGNKYDFKIKYDDIARLFLLPKPDDIHMAFVIALDRPIRQGQQRYQMLVWQTTKETSELEIHLDPQVLAKEYQDNLQPVMQGSLCNLIAKTFKVIADKKVFVPGNFANAVQQSCVKCAYKANEGHLYPLEKSFVFIHKPPLMIRFEEIESVEFQRYHNASVHQGSTTRNFDLCITLHPTMGGSSYLATDGVKEYVFSGIDRSDYPGLYNFLSGKKIRIKNLQDSSEGRKKNFMEAGTKTSIQDDLDEDNDDEDEEDDEDFAEDEDESDEDSEDEDDDDDDDMKDDDDSDLREHRKANKDKAGKKRPRDVEEDDEEDEDSDEEEEPKQKKKAKTSTKSSESTKKKKKDPNAPKRAMTAYIYFCAEMRPMLQQKNSSLSFAELAKLLGQKFKEISPQDKKKYEDMARADKERYEKEMKEYKLKNRDVTVGKSKPSASIKKASGMKKKQESDSDDSDDSDE
jgi:structure-specific recognition protein 1